MIRLICIIVVLKGQYEELKGNGALYNPVAIINGRYITGDDQITCFLKNECKMGRIDT